MAVTPINLNKVRKARAKADAKDRADANAAYHGLTKAERTLAKARTAQVTKLHAGGKRSRPEEKG